MAGQDCGFLGTGCVVQDWVNSAVGNAIDNMAKAVQEAFGKGWPRWERCG